jgi:hypothetical protein
MHSFPLTLPLSFTLSHSLSFPFSEYLTVSFPSISPDSFPLFLPPVSLLSLCLCLFPVLCLSLYVSLLSIPLCLLSMLFLFVSCRPSPSHPDVFSSALSPSLYFLSSLLLCLFTSYSPIISMSPLSQWFSPLHTVSAKKLVWKRKSVAKLQTAAGLLLKLY